MFDVFVPDKFVLSDAVITKFNLFHYMHLHLICSHSVESVVL
jgi:hypothetical protein